MPDTPYIHICDCDGCWCCPGRKVECTCDVDWDQLTEDRLEGGSW